MKKENIEIREIEFLGCKFYLGASKKFDRDFETCAPILKKAFDGQEPTAIEKIILIDTYNVSHHDTGKIAGINSMDSTATNCEFCKNEREAAKDNPAHVCGGCYDFEQENSYKGRNMVNRHTLNMLIMMLVRFTREELARVRVGRLNRVNSSGDTPNKTYALNMLDLAFINKWALFGYWAKNTKDVISACDEIGKPENMILVQSSCIIGKATKIKKYFDYTFTVYVNHETTDNAIKSGSMECNGKSCKECGYKCYYGSWKKGANVAEYLRIGKEQRNAIEKYIESKPTIKTGSQKELVDYVSEKYGLTKKSLNDFIKAGRKNNLQWDNMIVNGMDITFYLQAGKMYIGERKAA